MSTPRIHPGSPRQIGLINNAICTIGARVTGRGKPNLFTTLGRRRGLFRGWLFFSATMMPFGILDRRETELMILRIAHNRDCEYERRHHQKIGRKVGVTREEMARIGDADASAWSTRHRAMFAAIDQLGAHRAIDDTCWAELARHLCDAEIIELLMLSGQYESLATTIMTIGIQPD